MRDNRLRTLWREDKAAINGWLAIANGFAAETMAHQGWDTLTIDLQHGVVDYQAMVPMLQAISTTLTVPIVRVPWLEPGIIMKTLDAGAYAVICPMVNTRDDAQKLVAWTHYAPRGTRSFGPVRAALDGGADGLDFYRFLAEQAPAWLVPPGRVMLEFGDGQETALPDIFQRQGWRVEAIEPDYARKPRLFLAGRSE